MIRLFKDLKPVLLVFWQGPRWQLAGGICCAIITALCGLALLGLSGWFITATALAGMSAATAIAFDVFSPSAGIRFFALARTAGRYGERLITHDATLGILADLRERLFRRSAAMRESEKLRKRPATLLFRLTQDIDALDSLYLRIIVPSTAAIASALIAGIAIGSIDVSAGIAVVLILFIGGIGIPLLAARRAVRPAIRRNRALETLRARVIDLSSGQTELLMAGRLPAQMLLISQADSALSAEDDDTNKIEILAGAALNVVNAALIASAIVFTSSYVRAGIIDAPVAALVVLVVIATTDPFLALRRGAIEFGRTIIAARRVGGRLETLEPQAPDLPSPGVAVIIKDVTCCYPGARHPSLSRLSLSIAQGDRVALIGPSGAGKSTLLSLIASEIPAASGKIASLPSTLLTQRTELFADTLRDNLLLANAKADSADLANAIASAGLGDCLAQLPLGLDTRLGEGGLGLSGGEARRLALARLFLRDTPLWLLDEPTEGLDDATARDVIARLMVKLHGRTLVLATHIRREAEMADRLVWVDQGQIIAQAARGESQFVSLLARLRQD
ncbi:thiol reductant ABC exporter subunit CydC [Hyphomicrobium sp.]|uniref:thiol reductant ABC exporter subunit CydC n=1 Tax=Hyphomicrobium sp. TaxID=82 RepID=UPI000FA0EF5E|nr:thiol reductant ABC exporter subunit CydC [Hyphomicrobium sp.]RUO97508.1 MAG: thiol reductant ABC exporter subunit CydC [Hyphomicrobium sp.]